MLNIISYLNTGIEATMSPLQAYQNVGGGGEATYETNPSDAEYMV